MPMIFAGLPAGPIGPDVLVDEDHQNLTEPNTDFRTVGLIHECVVEPVHSAPQRYVWPQTFRSPYRDDPPSPLTNLTSCDRSFIYLQYQGYIWPQTQTAPSRPRMIAPCSRHFILSRSLTSLSGVRSDSASPLTRGVDMSTVSRLAITR